jgi:hypothetical protein
VSGGSSGKSNPQSNQASSEAPGENPGTSPLDRAGSDTTSREATPQMPERSPETASSTRAEGAEQAGRDKPKDADAADAKGGKSGRPLSPRASNAPPSLVPGSKPPLGATEVAGSRAHPAERWGDLPLHARDVFRTEGGADMPALYRDWIDAYYKRLNKKP